jgi:hypothetical protein
MQGSKYSKPEHGTSGSPKGAPARAPKNRPQRQQSGPMM